MDTSLKMGHVCPFLEMDRHINHMALSETQMNWLAYILQNYSPSP
jgi:hypothetical protein